jgi:hypothetical protein
MARNKDDLFEQWIKGRRLRASYVGNELERYYWLDPHPVQ